MDLSNCMYFAFLRDKRDKESHSSGHVEEINFLRIQREYYPFTSLL